MISTMTGKAMYALARARVMALTPPAPFAPFESSEWMYGFQADLRELSWRVFLLTSFEPVGLRPYLEIRDRVAINLAGRLVGLQGAASIEPDVTIDHRVGVDLLTIGGPGVPVQDARDAEALAEVVREFLAVTVAAARAAFGRRDTFLSDPLPRAAALPGACEVHSDLSDFPLLAAGVLACSKRFDEARAAVAAEQEITNAVRARALAKLAALEAKAAGT